MGDEPTLNLYSVAVGTYIPKGARYGLPRPGGKFLWDNADRRCEVQFVGFDAQHVRFVTKEVLAGPDGPIAIGTELVTTHKWLRNHSDPDDTQKIYLDENDEGLDAVEGIIENLRESIWDIEHEPGYVYDLKAGASVKRMIRNLADAKKQREILRRKVQKDPNNDDEEGPFDPFGVGIFL